MEYIDPEYIPIIKTTDAELRGYENLSEKVKQRVLPVFELTRSRRSKKSPHGNIHKRMERIADIVSNNPFILDLTAHDDLTNPQIEDLLDERGGFLNWIEFLHEHSELEIIPAIHLYEDTPKNIIEKEVELLLSNHKKVALRIDADDTNSIQYVNNIRDALQDDGNLSLIIDGGFIDRITLPITQQLVSTRYHELTNNFSPWSVAACTSSFPQSVLQVPGCEDSVGEIPLLEKDLYNFLRAINVDICYGDFASIHPVRYSTRGGAWVPRIDAPLDNSIIYKRHRRSSGGYIECARKMISDSNYSSIGCWGNTEIENAAAGNPSGLSPSFWIAVRLNIHISNQMI